MLEAKSEILKKSYDLERDLTSEEQQNIYKNKIREYIVNTGSLPKFSRNWRDW